MPIYEFSCDDCGESFEKLVRSSSADAVECPECGSAHVTKRVSTFAARTGGRVGGLNSSAPACGSAGGT